MLTSQTSDDYWVKDVLKKLLNKNNSCIKKQICCILLKMQILNCMYAL